MWEAWWFPTGVSASFHSLCIISPRSLFGPLEMKMRRRMIFLFIFIHFIPPFLSDKNQTSNQRNKKDKQLLSKKVMMEASGFREFPPHFFRFPSGLSFHSKLRNQSEKAESSAHFLSSLHGLLPGPPRSHHDLGHAQSPEKSSFSIDSLLGLKDHVGRGGVSDQRLLDWKSGHHPVAQDFHPTHPNLQHPHEERKTKVGLRYSPYKRERKGAQQAEGQESKDAVSRSGKAKRVRTIFTPEQLEKLESEFERQQYMVGTERSYLADSLDLTEAQVKVWFQNRRIKWRKVHLEMQQERLRALRSQETQEDFEESSGSSSSGPSPASHRPFPVPPHPLDVPLLPVVTPQPESEDKKETGGGLEGMKSTDWDASLFDVDAYLFKTLGSLRPVARWTCPPCPSQPTSESETDSD